MGVELTELDFDVLKEPWNVYQLEEGPILRTKYVLTRVVRKREEGGGSATPLRAGT